MNNSILINNKAEKSNKYGKKGVYKYTYSMAKKSTKEQPMEILKRDSKYTAEILLMAKVTPNLQTYKESA